MEPISHYFYSDRLKLQFWDWGTEGKPALILVHGGLDHARNWDWVAKALRDDYHVYALDLRGHGNSAWAPGALYSVAEHVLDLSVLADIINRFPVRIIGHSLGAITTLFYAGVHPERVHKLVAIEGLGLPIQEALYSAPERIRRWIEKVRALEDRTQRSYPDLAAAVARMKAANPFLSDQVAQHLTLHGTNWNADGSIIWNSTTTPACFLHMARTCRKPPRFCARFPVRRCSSGDGKASLRTPKPIPWLRKSPVDKSSR